MGSGAGTGSSVGRGFALGIPFLLFFAGVFFLSMFLLESVVEENSYFKMLVSIRTVTDDIETEEEDDASQEIAFVPAEKPATLSKIPSIPYGKKFAVLNVSGWKQQDIPVYLGSDKKILKKGAGMSFGSYFPGEGGCTIVSAHVTREFGELEDTPIGATVTIQTNYGPYTYRVTEKRVANGTDYWYKDAGQKWDLMMYTCYPRDNGGKRRTERCVLLCTLIDGTEVSG